MEVKDGRRVKQVQDFHSGLLLVSSVKTKDNSDFF